MNDYDKMCLLAQHMRYHEHLAELLPRGSRERYNHSDLAQQYRDEILGNARSSNTNVQTRTVGQEKK